jgi:hypothetical protein
MPPKSNRGQKMKTSIELISNLDRHAKKWGGALLIVGFPTTTRVVPDSFPDRLRLLEDLLQQGGIPVGILGMDTIAGKTDFFCCVLEDRIADEWAEPYVEAFANKFLTAGPGEVFSESIGIDEFRARH